MACKCSKYLHLQLYVGWLSVEEVCKLDSALCCQKFRPTFLHLIKNDLVFCAPSKAINGKTKDSYYAWLDLKEVTASVMRINLIKTQTLAKLKKLKSSFNRLTSLDVTNASLTKPGRLDAFGAAVEHLKHLELSDQESTMKMKMCTIDQTTWSNFYQNLISLKIVNITLDITGSISFRSLERLHLENTNYIHCLALAETLTELTLINCKDCTQFRSSLLSSALTDGVAISSPSPVSKKLEIMWSFTMSDDTQTKLGFLLHSGLNVPPHPFLTDQAELTANILKNCEQSDGKYSIEATTSYLTWLIPFSKTDIVTYFQYSHCNSLMITELARKGSVLTHVDIIKVHFHDIITLLNQFDACKRITYLSVPYCTGLTLEYFLHGDDIRMWKYLNLSGWTLNYTTLCKLLNKCSELETLVLYNVTGLSSTELSLLKDNFPKMKLEHSICKSQDDDNVNNNVCSFLNNLVVNMFGGCFPVFN